MAKNYFKVTKRTTSAFKGFEIELDEIIKIIKKGPATIKQKNLTSESVRAAFEQFPIHYLELSVQEKGHLDTLIDIIQAKVDSGTYQAQGKLESFKKIREGKEGVIWNSLKSLKQDFQEVTGSKIDIGHSNTSNAVLWYTLLDKYLPPDIDRSLIKKSISIVRKLDEIKPTDSAVLRSLNYKGGKKATNEDVISFINVMKKGFRLETDTVLQSIMDGTNNTSIKLNISFQSPEFTKFTGSAVGKIGKAIANYNGIASTALANHIVNKTHGFPNVTNSWGLLKFIDEWVTGLITGKPPKKTAKTTKRSTRTLLIGGSRFKNALKRFTSKKISKVPDIPKVEAFNYLSITNLINEVLAIRVREQMDTPSDPPINLRNQTGRFSESAKLLTLTRSQTGLLMGSYTYMRDPYDVFLPGGYLNPPVQRDPRLYIEGAIRETAQSILRQRFPGIDLRLT